MDRNFGEPMLNFSLPVALRKESVDRNSDNRRSRLALDRSLSARRAWIEIIVCLVCVGLSFPSLSARRAWIEIFTSVTSSAGTTGSLSARRAWIEISKYAL